MLAAAVVAAVWLGVSGARGDIISHGGTPITMDFVTIGSAGNLADDTGYGRVTYDYRIGTYEVSADQWASVLAAAPGVGNAGNWSGSQPTAGTSWYEAARFCNWLTTGDTDQGVYDTTTWAVNRSYRNAGGMAYFIPTEDEWYKAAYYNPADSTYYEYPTGSNTAPTATAGSTTAGQAVYGDQAAPANVDNSGGLSPFLTMGQGGNVWEWNETEVEGGRGRRGGSFADGGTPLRRGYRRSNDPANGYDGLGFVSPRSALFPSQGRSGCCWAWRG
jgi:formylglycine-generating enzyme required for sulfatase activity